MFCFAGGPTFIKCDLYVYSMSSISEVNMVRQPLFVCLMIYYYHDYIIIIMINGVNGTAHFATSSYGSGVC